MILEKTIKDTLNFYNIDTFADKKNIGIWFQKNNQIKKIAAIYPEYLYNLFKFLSKDCSITI